MNENQIDAMQFFLRVWTKETGRAELIRSLTQFMRKIGDGTTWGELSAFDRLQFYSDFLIGK